MTISALFLSNNKTIPGKLAFTFAQTRHLLFEEVFTTKGAMGELYPTKMWWGGSWKLDSLLGLIKRGFYLYSIGTNSVLLLCGSSPSICCLKAVFSQPLDVCLVVCGSLGLLELLGVFAQLQLPGKEQQHIRAVWITVSTLPTLQSGPSDSLSGLITSNCACALTSSNTNTVTGWMQQVYLLCNKKKCVSSF